MKLTSLLRRSAVALTLIGATAGSLAAAGTFEGRVDMKMTSGNSDEDEKPQARIVHYTLKGDKMRMDFDGETNPKKQHGMNGPAGMIIDLANREITILMTMEDENGAPKKVYMRRPMQEPKTKPSDADKKDTTVPTPTGRTDTIAGYSASEYKAKDKDGDVTELWLAKGLGNFMSPSSMNSMNRGGASGPAWEMMVREGGFFPMKVITHDKSGALLNQMEVVKVDKASVPDSAFSTEGYSEMQLPFGAGAGKRSGSGLGDKLKGMNPFSR